MFYSKCYDDVVAESRKITATMEQVDSTHIEGSRCLGRVVSEMYIS